MENEEPESAASFGGFIVKSAKRIGIRTVLLAVFAAVAAGFVHAVILVYRGIYDPVFIAEMAWFMMIGYWPAFALSISTGFSSATTLDMVAIVVPYVVGISAASKVGDQIHV